MAEKILNTRILNKVATLQEWNESTLKLKKGELAFCTVAASAGTGLTEPVVMVKIGTEEEKTFSELPWAFHAKASDVLEAAKSEAGLTKFVKDVLTAEGVASDSVLQDLVKRVTDAEGEIDTLQADLNTAETGLKDKMTAAEAAIKAIEGKFGADNVAAEINAAIVALELDKKYEVKGEAAKVQTALNEYKNTNDAAVQANANAADANAKAIAAIKDGKAMDSFADVEAALEGKEAAGAAAAAEAAAKAYADGLAVNYDAKGSAAAAQSAAETYAKNYADGLAGNYDAAGSAAQALTDAKAYTDSFTGGKTVSAYVGEVIANYSTTAQMNTAIATAKGEAVAHANGLNTAMDERVQALEAIDHSHTFVESELNLIQSGDVAKWNAAEQNAKTYADGLNTAMDSRVDALEAKFTGNDSVAKQISDAVAAEAALREAADAGLQGQIGVASAEGVTATGLHAKIEAVSAELERLTGGDVVSEAIAAEALARENADKALDAKIKAISDDYLKAADKTELQGNIDTLTGVVETLRDGIDADKVDGVKDLIDYVDKHGAEVTGMKKDISDNAAAIKAVSDDYLKAADKTELSEAINGIAADLETLEADVAKKALASDLEGAISRIGTVEGKVSTLEGEMDAAQEAIAAIDELVGDESVAKQITDVTDPLTARVVELEKVDHSHANATELDKIADGDKAKWDAKLENVTAAADSGLKATKTGNSVAIEIDDTLTWVFDCGGAN